MKVIYDEHGEISGVEFEAKESTLTVHGVYKDMSPRSFDYSIHVSPDDSHHYFWTTEPPKEPGVYWALDGDKPRIAEVLYSYGDQLCADFTDENVPTPLSKVDWISHWLGPLPVPDPPKVE
ncbi:MAG TPA: hypothetical protein VFU31_05440 [Candidatus Binatia bacterium]|nr:hypothetical protein [Candidatus Binatia bacterium]